MNSFRLQSNPTSTFAYSQLNKTQALLNKNIQRLSVALGSLPHRLKNSFANVGAI